MKRKFLMVLLVAEIALLNVFVFSACDNQTQTPEPTAFEKVYAQYVVYAEAQGKTPLSYEDWLTQLKAQGNLHFQRIDGKDEYRVAGIGTESELDIVIPSTYQELPVTEIGYGAFAGGINLGCTYIKSVVIPDSVILIAEGAFSNCINLTSVVMSNSVTEIGAYAFSGCSNLTNIVLSGSISSIEERLFYNCEKLTSVTIGNQVASIEEDAFFNCKSLTNIFVDDRNDTYKDIGGNLYNKNGGTLIKYAAGKESSSFAVPDHVRSIDDGAFDAATNLTSIIIGNNVETIGSRVFLGCNKLTSVTFNGTKEEWISMARQSSLSSDCTVYCTDGAIKKELDSDPNNPNNDPGWTDWIPIP